MREKERNSEIDRSTLEVAACSRFLDGAWYTFLTGVVADRLTVL